VKQITIISGKGGTGKTTVAASFIKLAHNHVAVDCDVDAANLHIILNPVIKEKNGFKGGAVAKLVGNCIKCGKCEQMCRFEAISNSETEIIIDELRCEGCGVCEYVCPTEALKLIPDMQGEYYISQTDFGPFIHARLNAGAENSGKLVTRVRNAAEDIAYSENKELIIIDGAPGIGCAVIASINGVDAALIVTEPTLSGMNDFYKVFEVAKYFQVKAYVCINKYDVNMDNAKIIEKFCADNNIEIIGSIPYDERVPQSIANKTFIVDDKDSIAGARITEMFKKLEKILY